MISLRAKLNRECLNFQFDNLAHINLPICQSLASINGWNKYLFSLQSINIFVPSQNTSECDLPKSSVRFKSLKTNLWALVQPEKFLKVLFSSSRQTPQRKLPPHQSPCPRNLTRSQSHPPLPAIWKLSHPIPFRIRKIGPQHIDPSLHPEMLWHFRGRQKFLPRHWVHHRRHPQRLPGS